MVGRYNLGKSRVFPLSGLTDRASFDSSLVGDDETHPPGNKPDAANDPSADKFVLHSITGQGSNLEEEGAFIEQHLDTFARKKLAARDVAFNIMIAAPECGF